MRKELQILLGEAEDYIHMIDSFGEAVREASEAIDRMEEIQAELSNAGNPFDSIGFRDLAQCIEGEIADIETLNISDLRVIISEVTRKE